MTEVQAIRVEFTLAGTITAAKPRTEALDRTGKLTFEYDSSQAALVDQLMKMGYDVATGMVYTLDILIQRGSGMKRDEKKNRRGKRVEDSETGE